MLAWEKRYLGLWKGQSQGIHAQVCNWSPRDGYGLIMWGTGVPEGRNWETRYESAEDAMRAADELAEGWG